MTSDQNEALLAAVLRTAIDAIITIDDRGVIQQANHAVEKLFGYSVAEVVGKNVSMLMPEPDRSRHVDYLSRYKETRQAAIIGIGREVMGQRKDGSHIPVDLAVSEVNIGGRTLFAGILRDMTQRNRAEAELKDAEQKIIQSERLAAIGQMITGIAHESRNALQRSRACLDMLELDLEAHDEQKDLVQRTRFALIELQTLYEEVRSYAAPIVLEKSIENVNELCSEVWGKILEERGAIPISLEVQAIDPAPCKLDKYKISQVIRNVFENAIAVSKPGNKITVVCVKPRFQGHEAIQIRIMDEGPGLDSVQRERIFEPFYTTKTKGTGLGMAICQRIIDAHGGTISIGNPEIGAEIVIEIPCGASL
ncbi:MAG: PAS domain S-box protein [Planctomycetota bacterium]|nr:PAS domain S-box protein [Planctomycetota bacterium]